MRDERAPASDEPRATSQEAISSAADAPPPDTPPTTTAGTATTAGDGSAETPAPAGAYVQFKVITWADTKGRTFVELQGTMGEAPIYRGMVLVERAYADGVGARRQIAFDIAATCVDEAFKKFDEAQATARKAGEEETDREHTRAVLSGKIPQQPLVGVPLHLPTQGQGGRRRRN